MKILYLLALAGALGCASTGAGAPSPGGDRNVITENELASVPSSNLYELIEKLRPNFLRSRGATSINTPGSGYPVVYLDGRQFGEVSSLRSIVTSQVEQVRYYDSSRAAAKFGMINASGVIEVTIRR